MKNALVSGSIIGLFSFIWIFAAQKMGFYPSAIIQNGKEWINYTALIIPFLGLYFGLKSFKSKSKNRFCFATAVFQGFKILAVGGLLAAIFSIIYLQSQDHPNTIDYMEFMLLAIGIGLLFTLINAFLLMDIKKKY
ncbi:DUF4199 family protein [Pedobacter sp. SD-b]|uniref:DUF4199 family protein n=1 Tax=Pedobacter segetis TaxID=2793069 RepID=A0ABS1BH71_9SPHI|nr:DUF4199 family protein [Pedobacter segetis]MBK0382218.1 DUF4199 family protein [Pedobacter segetis]